MKFKLDENLPAEAAEILRGGFVADTVSDEDLSGPMTRRLRARAGRRTIAYFFDRQRPEGIRLHLVCDEILSLA